MQLKPKQAMANHGLQTSDFGIKYRRRAEGLTVKGQKVAG